MRWCTVLLLVCVCLFVPSQCPAWQGKVASVNDGDYATVLHDGKGERVRFYGVECPKKHQEGYQQAREFVSKLIAGRVVEVDPVGKDRYGRTVAQVVVDGKNLSRELIMNGLAWVHVRECRRSECRDWLELEEQAKIGGVSIWATPNPIPPWEFKEGRPMVPIYSGDVVRHVFHSTNCPEYNCKSCIVTFKGRAKATAAGYSPCTQCRP